MAKVPHLRAEGPVITCGVVRPIVPSDPEGVALHWENPILNSGGILSQSCDVSDRLTAPRTGLYSVTAAIEWPGVPDTASRTIGIRRPGGRYLVADTRTNVPEQPVRQNVSTLLPLAKGESVQVWITQLSPVPLELERWPSATNVTMQWVGNL